MNYILNIDWLALYCTCPIANYFGCAEMSDAFEREQRRFLIATNDLKNRGGLWFKKQPYGTRQFEHLYFCYIGKEKFAEVQIHPHAGSILHPDSAIVKVENRRLYAPNLWQVLDAFLRSCQLVVQNISRLDLAADFVQFHKYLCPRFIEDVMSSKICHIGRGGGGAYFVQRSRDDMNQGQRAIHFNGLSYGSHSSAVRAYLYNKTIELVTVADKPWIREKWNAAGLTDPLKPWQRQFVWRLEISIKAEGLTYKAPTEDATNEENVRIDYPRLKRDTNADDLKDLYRAYVNKYFRFYVNAPKITNVTVWSRKHGVDLFGDGNTYKVAPKLRPVNGSTRTERILIKSLWQMADKYRIFEDDETTLAAARTLSTQLAKGTDLDQWMKERKYDWDIPSYNH